MCTLETRVNMTNLTRSKSFTIIVRGQRQRALFLKSGNFLKQQLTCLEKSLGKGPVVQPCPVHLQNHAPCSLHLLVGYKKNIGKIWTLGIFLWKSIMIKEI